MTSALGTNLARSRARPCPKGRTSVVNGCGSVGQGAESMCLEKELKGAKRESQKKILRCTTLLLVEEISGRKG